MKLDCRGFERLLEAFLERRTLGEEKRAAFAHLAGCDRCRELVSLGGIAADTPVDLTRGVLERTTGLTCGPARDRLCDLVDGTSGTTDAELVSTHLAECPACASRARVLHALALDLPWLAELDPGAEFTRRVLARTLPRRPRLAVAGLRWWNVWRQWVLRPRFAMEGAYVLTAVVLLLFGVPGSLVAGLSRQVGERAVVELPGVPVVPVDAAREQVREGARKAWRVTGGHWVAGAHEAASRGARTSRDAADEVLAVVGTLWSRVASEQADDNERVREHDERDDGERP